MSRSKRSTERIQTRDGTELHCETIFCGADSWLIGVHGIGEHIGRKDHLSQLFTGRYNLFRYDLRGHGKSDGRRGYVESFDLFYQDLEDLVGQLAAAHPNFRYALFGHSMGALIAAGFVQRRTSGVLLPERLFLASPPIGIGGRRGAMVNCVPKRCMTWLRKVPFSVAIGSTVSRRGLSHEKAVVEKLEDDPLSLDRLHTKLLFNLVESSKEVFSRPIAAPCPLYAAVGSGDRVVSCPEARRYFSTHEPSAELRIIDGAYHELHNESATYRDPYFAFLRETLGSD